MEFTKKLAMLGIGNLVIGLLIGVWGELLKFNYDIPMGIFMTIGLLFIVGAFFIVISEI
jgi:hypothetical protein